MEILLAKKRMENEEGLNHIMAKIKPEEKNEKVTKPIALIVLLDKSGSMREIVENKKNPYFDLGGKGGYYKDIYSNTNVEFSTKLDYAKQATKRLIDTLKVGSMFGMVSFSDSANIEIPLEEVNDERKYCIKDRVEAIKATGMTNISDALEMAYNTISPKLKETHHIKMILLSDGHANYGIDESDGIASLVRRFEKNGVSVTTVGVGTQYNSHFMETIATASGGMFYHLKNMNQLNEIFSKELDKLITLTMKSARISFRAEEGILLEENLNGYEENEKGKIYLGNVYNELKIVYQISTIERVVENHRKVIVILEYLNEENEKCKIEREIMLVLVDEEELEMNQEVVDYVKILMEAKTKREALRYYEEYDVDMTNNTIHKGIGMLDKLGRTYHIDTTIIKSDILNLNQSLTTRNIKEEDIKEMYATNYNVLRNNTENK